MLVYKTLRPFYLTQRKAFPQNAKGVLTKAGKSEAFQFAVGLLIGYDHGRDCNPAQDPGLFLLQVRGADDYFRLDNHGRHLCERARNHYARLAVTELGGDYLCQECANNWVREEGVNQCS